MIPQKHRGKAAAGAGCLAIAAVCVTNFEGERLKTYRDIVGVKTYCVGETRNAHMGQSYTHAECQQILQGRLKEFADGVGECVHVPMSDDRYAASISLAYNIGIGAFCRSSYVRALNARDPRACDYMLRYDMAGGREITGLRRRREAERKLCMAG